MPKLQFDLDLMKIGSIFPPRKVNGHFFFRGEELKNHKTSFSPKNLEVESFPDLSSDLKLVEQKPSYDNLKILVGSEIKNEVSQLT